MTVSHGLWAGEEDVLLHQTEHMRNLQFRNLLSSHKGLFLMCSREGSDMVSLFVSFEMEVCNHKSIDQIFRSAGEVTQGDG